MKCSVFAFVITLLPLSIIADDQKKEEPTLFNSSAKADAEVAGMNRSIQRILLSEGSRSRKDKKTELLNLQDKLNKEYGGKTIRWQTMLAKSVQVTEKRGDIIVPGWIAGSIGKLLTTSGNEVGKRYVISGAFDGAWAKGMNKGDPVVLNATIKEVQISDTGTLIALSGVSVSKVESKADVGNAANETSEKDARTAWSSRDGTRRFERVQGKIWREIKVEGQTKKSLFEEVNRNADFIELERGEDKLRIRIHNAVYYWAEFKNGAYDWKANEDPKASRGEWKKP